MMWLPDGKKIKDMFIRFDRMYERDVHTHTPHDGIGSACIASRGSNYQTLRRRYLDDRDTCQELVNNICHRYKQLLSGVYTGRVADTTSHTVQSFLVCRSTHPPNRYPVHK